MDTCFHLVKQSCIFSRNGDGEEALAKRLHEAQTEILALQKERDSLKRILRDRESAEGKVLVDTGEKLGDMYLWYPYREIYFKYCFCSRNTTTEVTR